MKRRNRQKNTRVQGPDGGAGSGWKRVLPVIAVVLVLLTGAAGLRALLTSRHHDEVGGPYALSDGGGRPVTQADFQGRYTLIYFGYTHCVDVCPLTLATVSAALGELGDRARALVPVFISVDPARDTPETVRDYAARFSPRIVGLTGSRAQIESVMDAFHVSARRHAGAEGGYLVDHSSLLYLMDGRNRLVGMIPVDSSAHQIATELARMLPAPG